MKTCNCNKITSDDQLILSGGQSSATWCGDDSCGSSSDYIYIENTTNCDDCKYINNGPETICIDLNFNNSGSTGIITSLIDNHIVYYKFKTTTDTENTNGKTNVYSINFSSSDRMIWSELYCGNQQIFKTDKGYNINIVCQLALNENYELRVYSSDYSICTTLTSQIYCSMSIDKNCCDENFCDNHIYVTGGKIIAQDDTYIDVITINQEIQLTVNIIPSNATDKTVYWSSSDPKIASISDSGKLVTKTPGTVVISARIADGEYTAYKKIKVCKATAKIMRDGGFSKVNLSSGKTWYCINHDMIYNENNANNSILLERANKNYWSAGVYGSDPIDFTTDELRLLYIIDPYGVAKYVQTRGFYGYKNVKDEVTYKDEVFCEIFDIETPKYFDRTPTGLWKATEDKSDLSKVISESEILFGYHNIFDAYTVHQLLKVAIDVLATILPTPISAIETASNIFSISMFMVALECKGFENAISFISINDGIESFLSEISPETSCLGSVLTNISTVHDLCECFVTTPNYSAQYIDYCAKPSDYTVIIELSNEIITAEELSEKINNMR